MGFVALSPSGIETQASSTAALPLEAWSLARLAATVWAPALGLSVSDVRRRLPGLGPEAARLARPPQAGLTWWSVVSPYGGLGSTAALVFVLLVAGVKAAWEDVKRHQEDRETNKSITHVMQPDGEAAVQGAVPLPSPPSGSQTPAPPPENACMPTLHGDVAQWLIGSRSCRRPSTPVKAAARSSSPGLMHHSA